MKFTASPKHLRRAAGAVLAGRGGSLFLVAVACCVVVFVSEWILI